MTVAIAGRLAKPVWFDTGLKMQDGTLRTIAAYDQVQLQRYKERVTDIENARGEVIDRIPWKVLSSEDAAAMAVETQKPVEGVTSTTGRKSRNG